MTDFSDCGLGVLEGKTIATVFEKMATADLVRRGGLFFSALLDERESQSTKPQPRTSGNPPTNPMGKSPLRQAQIRRRRSSYFTARVKPHCMERTEGSEL